MVVPCRRDGPTVLTFACGTPRSYDCTYSLPSRRMVAVSVSESAFTTDEPTPWRPPAT